MLRATAANPFDHPIELRSAFAPVGKGAEVAPEMFAVNGVMSPVDRVLDVSKNRAGSG